MYFIFMNKVFKFYFFDLFKYKERFIKCKKDKKREIVKLYWFVYILDKNQIFEIIVQFLFYKFKKICSNFVIFKSGVKKFNEMIIWIKILFLRLDFKIYRF